MTLPLYLILKKIASASPRDPGAQNFAALSTSLFSTDSERGRFQAPDKYLAEWLVRSPGSLS